MILKVVKGEEKIAPSCERGPLGLRYGSAYRRRQRSSHRLCYHHRTFQAAAAAVGKFYF